MRKGGHPADSVSIATNENLYELRKDTDHEVPLDDFLLQLFRRKSSEVEDGADLDVLGRPVGLRLALDVAVDQKLALVACNQV